MNSKDAVVNKLMKDGLSREKAEAKYRNIRSQIMNMIYDGRGV